MKKTLFAIPLLLVGVLLLAGCGGANVNGWIRINQLGYLPQSDKIAVMLILDSVQAKKSVEVKSFVLKDSATGKTVPQYVTEVRIKKAKELLSDPSLKIRAVANAVGYDDPAYFMRKFKQVTGVTPTEYQLSQKSRR